MLVLLARRGLQLRSDICPARELRTFFFFFFILRRPLSQPRGPGRPPTGGLRAAGCGGAARGRGAAPGRGAALGRGADCVLRRREAGGGAACRSASTAGSRGSRCGCCYSASASRAAASQVSVHSETAARVRGPQSVHPTGAAGKPSCGPGEAPAWRWGCVLPHSLRASRLAAAPCCRAPSIAGIAAAMRRAAGLVLAVAPHPNPVAGAPRVERLRQCASAGPGAALLPCLYRITCR